MKRRITPTSILLTIGTVLAAIALTLVLGAVASTSPTKNVVTHSAQATHSAATATPTATPTATATAAPAASPFTVVSTGTMKFSSSLTPPNFTGIFRIIDSAHGYTTGCTKYLITHSYAKGSGAPGNLWETYKVGDVITYQGLQYKINYTATPAQSAIGSEPIWGACDPNLLVMITCQSRGTAATNNFVIRAQRV